MAKKPQKRAGDMVASRGRPSTAFMTGERAVTMLGWNPVLRETRDDVRAAYDKAAARSVDAMQNIGWIAGAIEQAVADTVGTGLRLDFMPSHKALGMTPTRAKKWAAEVEEMWREYAETPGEVDIAEQATFGQMQAQAFRAWFATGEVLAELPWQKRVGSAGSRVRVVMPIRLARDTRPLDRIEQGIQIDRHGRPTGYLFRWTDVFEGSKEALIPARDRYGRKRITHHFDGMPGQLRGISPMVPVLKVARQYDQFANATLTGAIVQALFAATIKSAAPTQETIEGLLTPEEQAKVASGQSSAFDAWFDMVQGWYDQVTIDVGMAGRVAHLYPDQEFEMHTTKASGANTEAFARLLLREKARAIGITYEGMTGDYAGVTFSSMKVSKDDIHRIVLMRRRNVVAPFCQSAFENRLEEAIDSGQLPLPGGTERFLAFKAGICRAQWKGSPKPQPDDVKHATSRKLYLDMGVMSRTQIAADLDSDIDDVNAELAAEAKERERLGIKSDSEQKLEVDVLKASTEPEEGGQGGNTDD